jgi:hypothetical protein
MGWHFIKPLDVWPGADDDYTYIELRTVDEEVIRDVDEIIIRVRE